MTFAVEISGDDSFDFNSPTVLSAVGFILDRGTQVKQKRSVDVSRLNLLAYDSTGIFLPEAGSYTEVVGLFLRIVKTVGMTNYTIFTGQIVEIEPDASTDYYRLDVRSRNWVDVRELIPMYVDMRTDEIVTDILSNIGIPPSEGYDQTDKNWVMDRVGYDAFDSIKMWDSNITVDTGNAVDIFVSYDQPVLIWRVIDDLCNLEWGHFWQDRHGFFQFSNRGRLGRDADFTLDDTQVTDVEYVYAHSLVNHVMIPFLTSGTEAGYQVYNSPGNYRVRLTPAVNSIVGSLTLVSYPDGTFIRLVPGSTVSPFTPLVYLNASEVDVSQFFQAVFTNRGSYIEMNISGTSYSDAFVQPFILIADAYVFSPPVVLEDADLMSQVLYGYRPLRDMSVSLDQEDSENLMSFVKSTRGEPMAEITGFTLTPYSGVESIQAQLDIGSIVGLSLTRTQHSFNYRIDAIRHTLEQGSWITRYWVTPNLDSGWVMDDANTDTFDINCVMGF